MKLSSSARRLCSVAAVAIVLALAMPAEIRPVQSGNDLLQEDDDLPPATCALNDFITMPMDWEPGGSPHAITTDYDKTIDAGIVPRDLIQIIVQDDWPEENVSILIVDDFETRVASQTHGQYVAAVIEQLLVPLLGEPTSCGTWCSTYTADSGAIVRVEGVPVEGYVLDDIVPAIQNVMSKLDASSRFIINMSFVIVKCTEELSITIQVDEDEQTITVQVHDSIEEYEKAGIIMPVKDPDEDNLWQWIVTDWLDDGEPFADQLMLGDTIEVFSYEHNGGIEELPNPEPSDLIGHMLELSPDDVITLVLSNRGDTPEVEAATLYRALGGFTLIRQLAGDDLEGSPPSSLEDRERRFERAYLAISAAVTPPFNLPDEPALYQQLPRVFLDAQMEIDQQKTVVLVASAGNFNPAALLGPAVSLNASRPGSWEYVISVSASRATDQELTKYSQKGELKAPGSWYHVEFCKNRTSALPSCETQSEYLSGTSFASPAASVLLAYAASNTGCTGGSIAAGANCQGHSNTCLAETSYNNPYFSEAVFPGGDPDTCPLAVVESIPTPP